MLTLDASTIAALGSDSFEYAYICDLPANLHFTNHSTDLSYNSNSYISNGLVTGFSPVTQTQGMSLASYTLTLSNVDISVAQGYSSGNYRGQDATIYLAIVSNGSIIGTPTILYRGTLDSFAIKESGSTSSLTLKLTSHWANYNQRGGRYTSDSIQQGIHSGDRIFKYAHEESSDSLDWGKR